MPSENKKSLEWLGEECAKTLGFGLRWSGHSESGDGSPQPIRNARFLAKRRTGWRSRAGFVGQAGSIFSAFLGGSAQSPGVTPFGRTVEE